MNWNEIVERVRTGLRLNLGRIALVVIALGVSFWLLRIGAASPDKTFERDLLLVLCGGSLSAAVKGIADVCMRAEAYRQGAYTERARAVQEILAEARKVKSGVVVVLGVEPEEGLSREALQIQLDHVTRMVNERIGQAAAKIPTPAQERLEEARQALLRLAWHHRVWIGRRGEEGVRAFLSATKNVTGPGDGRTKKDVEADVNGPFGKLEALLTADLGFWPS